MLSQMPLVLEECKNVEHKKESGYDLVDYFRIIRKRFWLLVAIFIPIVTGVGIASYKMTPVYRATALLQIEKKTSHIVEIQDVYQMDTRPDDYYQTQYRLITSKRVCKKVLDALSSELSDSYGELPDPVGALKESIIVEPVRDTYLVKVSYESEDRQLAAKVANAVSDEYVATVRLEKKTVSDNAENKIAKKLPALKRSLTESEAVLRKFEVENSALSFQKRREIIYEALSELNIRAMQVNGEIAAAKARYDSISRAKTVEELLSLPQVVNNRTIWTYAGLKVQLETDRAELAQKYKPDSEPIKALDNKIKVIDKQIHAEALRITQSIKTALEEKNSESVELQALIAKQEELAKSIDARMSRYESLRADVDSNRELYKEFMHRQKELESSAQFDVGAIQIWDRAEVPVVPVRPNKKLNLILAGVFSLLGGIGLAFLLEYLDDTIKTHEDIEKFIKLPVLGVVPSVKTDSKNVEDMDLLVQRKPRSNVSEAYRSIRTSLLYTSPNQKEPKAFVVTSAGPREGKTTTAINLSIALAHAGKKVLVVDSDLRKPRVHKTFGIDGSKGLTNYLVGQDGMEDLIVKSEIENLSILPSGPIPPNPTELLDSERMRQFVAETKKNFDAIILDSPPLIAVTDGAVLAAITDGAIQVIWAGSTSRKLVEMGKESIESIGAKVIGVILNNLKVSAGGYYPYYHRYSRYSKYYGSPETEEEPAQKQPL
jgi:capsular exopolysaccharide synthesis family protein